MNEFSLEGAWRFQPDPFGEGEALGYTAADCDVSRWREVTVPTVFDRCGDGMQGYEGAGWFSRRVIVPADWQGKRVALNFGAVNYRAKVWVNGTLVAENADGFLPFESAVTAAVHCGKANVVTVCADNTRRAGDVPGLLRGWRPHGGILRTVTLSASDPLRLGRITVTAGADGAYKFGVEVINDRETEAITQTWIFLRGPGDSMAMPNGQGFGERPMMPGKRSRLTMEGKIENPALWSPDSPTLYKAFVELHGDRSNVIDRREITFGFRTIAVEKGRITLNGAPILLLGFNRHEDSVRADMCADPETARQDLLRMKQLVPEGGVNFVRLCHYPHDTQTLDICDEIGLLVMAEIPLYWWGGGYQNQAHDEDPATKLANASRQLERLIERDRNHPSIIFWNVSNETDESKDFVVQGNADLIGLAKRLDPSRLAVHVSNRWPENPHFEADDVCCLNGYPTQGARSWNKNKNPDFTPADGGKWWREEIAKLRELYPDKPILISEFGYPAIAGVADGSIGEEAQAKTLEGELAGILDAGPFVSGATVWCWADHPWPEDYWINYLTTSPFGVVARDRTSKKGLDALKTAISRRPSLLLRRPNLENLPPLDLPEGYTLRVGVPDDAEGLAACLQKAFPEMTWTAENATNGLLAEESVKTVFVIENDGQIVATASARLIPDEFPNSGYVHWVGGDPDHRGKRLGYLASLATLHEFVRLGCKDTVLHTDDFRIPAIKVYLALGYRPEEWHATHPSRWAKLRRALGDRR